MVTYGVTTCYLTVTVLLANARDRTPHFVSSGPQGATIPGFHSGGGVSLIIIPVSARGRFRLMRIVGWGCVVLAIGFGTVAGVTWRSSATLTDRGVTTTASVVTSDYDPQGTSSITVRFTDGAGSPHDEPISVAAAPQPVGASVTVSLKVDTEGNEDHVVEEDWLDRGNCRVERLGVAASLLSGPSDQLPVGRNLCSDL